MTYQALRKNTSAAQADQALLDALKTLPVSALSDCMHRNIGTSGLNPYHRPGKATMAGTAVTAKSRGGDNLTYLRALEFCRPGDVLIVDGMARIFFHGAPVQVGAASAAASGAASAPPAASAPAGK